MNPRFPISTYRLQFHAGFTFADARHIVPYLSALGVTHVYASPILKARRGSTHGYDVIDFRMLNPELGARGDFNAYTDALAAHGMQQIVDIVPNHMGVATNENAWWNDCLKNGPASPYGEFFDIAWRDPSRPEARDKLLLPVLGESYGQALEQGKLKVILEAGAFFVTYYDRRFPLSTESCRLLSDTMEDLTIFNGTVGKPRSFDLLDQLLDRQYYRLAHWRTASDEINYRRFFDINDLAALRMERRDVFEQTHEFLADLIAEGRIAGLRVDHPDGLLDPAEYFARLQESLAGRLDLPAGERSFYVVAEKILAADEPMPADWLIQGTTGYDYINKINGLFVDPASAASMTQHYNQWISSAMAFEDLAIEKKRQVLQTSFAGALDTLAMQLERLAKANRQWRDFTLNAIRRALGELIAVFPVYRTYITSEHVSPRDVAVVEGAIATAIGRSPKIDPTIFRSIGDALLSENPGATVEIGRAEQAKFAGMFQQLTAPVAAKGIEDTAFYVYNRLVSLNEVGGDPGRFGIDPATLHSWLEDRQTHWPLALSPLSTHDTKRSEDVRARLNVLSEIPGEWWQRIARWSRMNEPLHRPANGKSAPDRNDEYLLYQTLVGAWPLDDGDDVAPPDFIKRIQEYMCKALREAKVNTSWTDVNDAYEDAVTGFIAGILSGDKSAMFLQDFRAFQRRISHLGLLNSLSQTALRLTSPGVPDTYQGTELWDFSLVDPDNRRPVDYAKRAALLSEIRSRFECEAGRAIFTRELIAKKEDGRVKLFLTWLGLTLRRERPDIFSAGEYIAAEVVGSRKEHVFSFIRQKGESILLVICPRLMGRLAPGELPLGEVTWRDTYIALPAGVANPSFMNRCTGEELPSVEREGRREIRLADALEHFPVALLVGGRWNQGL